MKSYTGRIYDPLNLRTEDIDIMDIAHHLSLECRFNGAVPFHYSVAQHSVYVSQEATTCPNYMRGKVCHAAHKLLHDASEAYLKDIPRPIKHSPDFEFYRKLEREVQDMIFARFDLEPGEMPPCVKQADDMLLLREGIDLMNERYTFSRESPSQVEIEQWSPERAKTEFLQMFRILCLE